MACVLFVEHPCAEGKKLVEVRLNAPDSLNALSLDMIEMIRPCLDQVRKDDSVVALLLRGSGERAFCAGGDIVQLYHAIQGEIDQAFIERWFMAEYAMDYTFYSYPKPIICWGNGIVMGGGMGIMNGCSHRIVTEKTRMAMPEVSIGLYPDVGASWFFNRIPEGIGQFLGLTGCEINAADALALGMADRYIRSERWEQMISDLQNADWSGSASQTVTRVLKQLECCTHKQSAPPSNILRHYKQIQNVTGFESAAAISAAILQSSVDSGWWRSAQSRLQKGSPLAAAIIHEQLKRSRHLSLREAFLSEMILTTRCCQEGELAEGIRALLIDKDQKPEWLYRSITDVDASHLERFFSSPWKGNPLAVELARVDELKKSAACRIP